MRQTIKFFRFVDMERINPPRLVIAGLSGDSGKTLVSLGLISYFANRGIDVSGFKKGPDYIDALWIASASGKPARNLDTFLMSRRVVYSSFIKHSRNEGLSIIEGNRGLYDGIGVDGVHSTAELAKLLKAPIILVLNITKTTRTVAAIIKGCMDFDPEVNIAGVILNRVGGDRHKRVVAEAVAKYTNIPVVGAIPKIKSDTLIPGRHLGLITPQEYPLIKQAIDEAERIVRNYVNIDGLETISRNTALMEAPKMEYKSEVTIGNGLRIGYFKDSAFTFYYPENLELLGDNGAELIPISSMDDNSLPDIDALYIGGGFPEMHSERIANNNSLMISVRKGAECGLPIYAECGGLIYLSQALISGSNQIPMAGVLPIKVKMFSKPKGHGYSRLLTDGENPYFQKGAELRGHEFHYTTVVEGNDKCTTIFKVEKGTGCFDGRDGIIKRNVLALYTHLHALGASGWMDGFIKAADRFHREKKRFGRDTIKKSKFEEKYKKMGV